MKVLGIGIPDLIVLILIIMVIVLIIRRVKNRNSISNSSSPVFEGEGQGYDDGTTIRFIVPMSKNPLLFYQMKLEGASVVDPTEMAERIAEDLVSYLSDSDIRLATTMRTIQIGDEWSGSKALPGVAFSFIDKPDFAKFLIGVNKIAGILDICAIQLSSTTSNMVRHQLAQERGENSFVGAFNAGMIDEIALEEEENYYSAVESAISAVINSYKE